MAKILVVEDRPVNRRFLVTLLQERGHRVFQAKDGDEALKIAAAETPEVAIIELLASEVDACRFATCLETGSAVRPRLIFRAPAYIEAEARAVAGDFGAFFLVRPSNPEALLAAVSAALAGPPPERKSLRPLEEHLRAIAGKLQSHAESLDRVNAQSERRIAGRDARLDMVRSALDQEIKKRLWAEQELTQSNRRLKDQVMHDELTGLHNRRYLEESLRREESRARRSGRSLGVMMIDIDDFKRFNDTLGHAAGDAVLRAMGQHLLTAARGEDIICRYGGEEFVLVMSHAPHDIVLERAENLRRGVGQLAIEYEGRLVGPISVSIGIGIFPEHGDSLEAVLRAADAAMYQAKQLGRDRVEISGPRVSA
ncbi:MAG TPA: diguanylate cyclase [Burkholderiales bacterium]|nr:diguanylate cyclase [Burkholderiales bacterium]